MKFICIMGRSGSGKTTVESHLEKMGFRRSISYTTREPQIRNGKLEQDGVEYRFVNEEQFMQLVNNGNIIEYQRLYGNLYGTPRPYGSKRFVGVVCTDGFKALKKLYGNQVIGIYLKCDLDVAMKRGENRDTDDQEQVRKRREEDEKLLIDMEECADIVINTNQDTNRTIADILKALKTI